MGYKIQFDNGKTVEFETQPTDADIDEAYQSLGGAPTKASLGTAVKSSFANVGNMADTAISTLAGGAAALFGDSKEAVSIEENLRDRNKSRMQWANPKNQEIGFGGKVAGTIATLPMQIAGAGFSPADTAMKFKDAGETDAKALGAAGIDAAGNALGMILPGFKEGSMAVRAATGGAANAAQDYATKMAIQALADTEQAKKQFEPSLEDAAVSGIVGASAAAAAGKKPAKAPTVDKDKAFSSSAVDRPQQLDIAKNVAELHDKAILQRLQEIDKQMNGKADIDLNKLEKEATVVGDEPFYVDPQGQTFRGNPDEPNARLALERQTEAMDNALDHPKQLQEREPLELLNTEQFRSANEGVHATPEDILNTNLKQELVNQEVDNHPLVRKAEERVQKQEELITKLQMMHGKGKGSTLRLVREIKNLENFEKALENTRKSVTEGTKEGRRPIPFNFKRQGGAINPEVFKEGFEKLKEIAGGIVLKAKSDGNTLSIEATKDNNNVGGVVYDRTNKYDAPSEQNLYAPAVGVKPEARGKGLAQEMYSFASELGNDIQVSHYLTKDGKKMWEGFEKKGLATGGRIPKKQRGALLIDPNDGRKGEWLADNPHLKLKGIVPAQWTPEQAQQAARGAADVDQNVVQGMINYFTKGGLYQNIKVDNPLIRFVNEQIMKADRQYRAAVQNLLHEKDSLGPISRALSNDEMVQITEIMNEADLKKAPLNEQGLRDGGYNDKQIAYFKKHREVMDAAFNELNAARKAAGLKPIDKRIAYAAMRSKGDFKKLVYDNNTEAKKIVGVIGSDYAWKLNHIAAKLEERGYHIGEERYYGGMTKEKGKTEYELMQTLEALAEKDERIRDFMSTLDEITRNEAYSMLNVKKHTLGKKGIFGMDGRKTEDYVVLPYKKQQRLAALNAREFLQSQLDYTEGALKLGHFSKAVQEIRPLLADENINMPNAKQWARDYIDNALGYNPTVGHYLEKFLQQSLDAKWMKAMRIGNSVVRRGVANTRKTVNTILLGLNPMFWMTNVVQPMKAMPGMKASLEAKGLDANFDFGTGWSYLSKAALTDAKLRFMPDKLSDLERGAQEYTKKNYVFGSDLVEHSNRARKDFGYYAERVGNFAAGKIERGTRQVMFYSFVHMLNDNGLSVKNGLYEAAHNLTDMTMNNYSRVERPQVYNVLGPVGETAANLASFKHNELSRISMFARQIADDKSARPILVELATQVALAGVKGVVGFQAADWLYEQITKMLGKPDSLTLRVIKMSEGLADAVKELGFEKTAEKSKYVLSHGAFSLAGVDMSNRLGLNNLVGNSLVDIAFPGVSKLGTAAEAGINFAKEPTEMNAKRFVREVSPGVLTGLEDLTWFSKGDNAHNRNTDELQVKRNSSDTFWKALGGTGVNESVQKAKLFEVNTIKKALLDKRSAAIRVAKDELFMDGKVSPETFQRYLAYQGDPNSFVADIMKELRKQGIPKAERDLLTAAASRSVAQLQHAKRLREAYGE